MLRGQHKHGRSTRLHSNKLHQTCRPVNQFEHVCVEECPLTTRHTANRSGDSCEESQRLSFGGSAPRRPKQEAGPRQDAAKEAAGTLQSRTRESRSHPHSGEPTGEPSPQRERTGQDDDVMTSTHSGWRGRRWCWSVQQTTRQRVPPCTIAGDRAEQSPTKGAVCRPSRHRLSDKVFPATHESGNTRGTAEFTTRPRVKQPSSGDNALYTRSARRGGERVVLGTTRPRAAREEACGKRTRGSARGRANSLSVSTLESHGVPWRAAHGVP